MSNKDSWQTSGVWLLSMLPEENNRRWELHAVLQGLNNLSHLFLFHL